MKKLLVFLAILLVTGGGVYLYRSRAVEAPPVTREDVPEPERYATYSCDDDMSVRAVFSNHIASVTLSDTRTLFLREAEATHGMRYESQNGQIIFWTEGSGAFIDENGRRTYSGCRLITAGVPNPKGDEVRSYENALAGITFYYPSLYYLREMEAGTPEKPQRAIVLVEDTQANRDLAEGKSDAAGEGPVSITVDIYDNKDALSAEEWAKQDTNWNLGSKKTEPARVGGVAGVSYTWDGLYSGRSTVVTNGEFAYVFGVTWLTPTDRILRDAESIMKSVIFADQ